MHALEGAARGDSKEAAVGEGTTESLCKIASVGEVVGCGSTQAAGKNNRGTKIKKHCIRLLFVSFKMGLLPTMDP